MTSVLHRNLERLRARRARQLLAAEALAEVATTLADLAGKLRNDQVVTPADLEAPRRALAQIQI